MSRAAHRPERPPPVVAAPGHQLFSGSRVFIDKGQEEALVRDCRKGDRRALDALVRRFERPVFNAAFRILGNADDAADVTQTTFLKLFANLDHYDPRYKLFSWIYRIAVNEALHQLDRRKTAEPFEDAPDVDTSERSAVQEELHREIQAVLMELNEDQRVVIVLRYFGELSYGEMAEILKLPEKTVKSRLYGARQALKGRLEDRGVFRP